MELNIIVDGSVHERFLSGKVAMLLYVIIVANMNISPYRRLQSKVFESNNSSMQPSKYTHHMTVLQQQIQVSLVQQGVKDDKMPSGQQRQITKEAIDAHLEFAMQKWNDTIENPTERMVLGRPSGPLSPGLKAHRFNLNMPDQRSSGQWCRTSRIEGRPGPVCRIGRHPCCPCY